MPTINGAIYDWLRDVLRFDGKAGRAEFGLVLLLQYAPALLFFFLDKLEVKITLTPLIFFGFILGICGSFYLYFATLCRRASSAGIPCEFVLIMIMAAFLAAIFKTTPLDSGFFYIWLLALLYVGTFNIVLLLKGPK